MTADRRALPTVRSCVRLAVAPIPTVRLVLRAKAQIARATVPAQALVARNTVAAASALVGPSPRALPRQRKRPTATRARRVRARRASNAGQAVGAGDHRRILGFGLVAEARLRRAVG